MLIEGLFGERKTNVQVVEEEAAGLEKRQRRRDREANHATRRMFKRQAEAANLLDAAQEDGNMTTVQDMARDKLTQAAHYRQQSRAKRFKARQLGERATTLTLETDNLAMDRANMRSTRAIGRENRVLADPRIPLMAQQFQKEQLARHEVQSVLQDALQDDAMEAFDGEELLQTDEAIREQVEEVMKDAALAQAPSVLPPLSGQGQAEAEEDEEDAAEDKK